MEEFISLFDTILERCATADLKLKLNKVKLVITSADILGLHWHNGKLSPSRHKIDPLSTVPPPSTVKGLRSWLGGIHMHEICLPGSQLATLTKPLDEQIPSSRSGKEEIVWSPALLSSFKRVQEILKQPHAVTILRKEHQVYLATDACSSLPAGGSKMFIKRPGEDKFLPSFNFGCQTPLKTGRRVRWRRISLTKVFKKPRSTQELQEIQVLPSQTINRSFRQSRT